MTNGKNLWIPIIVGTGIIVLNLLFWQELVRQEDVYIKRNAELAAASISHDIKAEIQARALGLIRMARRWELESGTTKPKWEADALNYYQDYPGFQALAWVDESNYVRWIIPLTGNEAAQNLNLTFEERRRTALTRARESRKVSMTRVINLAQGGKGFLVSVPLFPKNNFDGFIIGSFRSQILLDAILSKSLQQKYAIAIFDGNDKIYTNQENLVTKIPAKWQHNTEIHLNGITWRLKVLPTPALVATERSPLPNVVLSGGVLVAVLFAWGVYLTQQSQRQTQQLKAINHELANKIVESQQAEQVLQEYTKEVEDLYNNSPCGYHSLDRYGTFVRINDTELSWLGYTRDEIIGKKKFTDVITTSSLETFQKSFPLFQQQGWIRDLEFQMVRKDGTVLPVLLSATAIKDTAGNFLMTRSTVFDITARKQAETELRNLSTALESAVEGISQFNPERRYIYVNQAYAKIVGYQPQEILGTEWQQTIHPEDQEKVMMKYQRMLEHGKAEVEARGVRQDGSVFDMQVVMVKAWDRHENYKGYYCFVKDISHRREIERIKDEFVSVVSHELRTPLTSIRGSLGLIASGVLSTQPEKAQRMLDIAVNNTDRLIRLINDILDIERIESGKVTMTKQICDVTGLMQQSVEEIQSMADKAGVTLAMSPILAKLWADPDRIVQTFTNLLSNAIKFSPQGSTISFSAKEEGSGEQSVHTPSILFTMRDRGRGIPADKIETIFGRFQQVDASDSRKKGGTGLGLAICRSIIQCHDGRIWAESTVGEGSTFYISLPLYREEEPIIPSVPLNNSDSPLILVCDDDPSVRIVMQTMLEQRGYQTICAASGQEAIEVAIKQQPDAIFLNLMMPGMHGWETLGVLKQQPQTKDIPAIVLSGLMPDARTTPHSHVTDWIVKPPDEKLLFQALERALAGEKSQSLKVLVVEDDTDLAQVLIAVFERHGVETYYARTGREALRLSQRILPDLLVLDLALPEVDGFAVVDWLRHHRRLCMVPLVVYCAKDLNNFDRERLKLGQTLFFTKGRVTPEEFEEHIVSLLNRIIPTIKGDSSDSQTNSYH
ncbi:PAS domain S-box protein [Scytonema sp. NUACC26]|uniref:PAS domain S-box protein n=1 Tax=Scytonema sp. NUACC26 TaxID=3140176 RepID=UPI0034DB83E0